MHEVESSDPSVFPVNTTSPVKLLSQPREFKKAHRTSAPILGPEWAHR